MRVGILRATWVAGGAERYLIALGDFFGSNHEVEYITLSSDLPTRALHVLGVPALPSRFRHCVPDSEAISKLSQEYDLFINAASHLVVAAQARVNWLVVFSPGSPRHRPVARARRWLARLARGMALSTFGRTVVRDAPRRRLALYPAHSEDKCLSTYNRIIAISKFVQQAISRKWHADSFLLYPCINTSEYYCHTKESMVVSIGRFAPYGNHKQHQILIQCFRDVAKRCPGWTLHLAGSLEEDSICRDYLAHLRELASDLPVVFHPNIDTVPLRRLLSVASLYWHAAGFGIDAISCPDAVEQFGISVVEAMASGAIPLVVPAGGVTEIVTHDSNGLFWCTPSQLVDGSTALIRCTTKQHDLRSVAVSTSGHFDIQQFNGNLSQLLSSSSLPREHSQNR